MQINPCAPLRGEITVPGDKSISHRAVMLGALASGTTHITGFLMGEDCLSTIDCFRKMGVSIDVSEQGGRRRGVGLHGLTAPEERAVHRQFRHDYPSAERHPRRSELHLDHERRRSIQKRPMGRVMKPLREMARPSRAGTTTSVR